MRWEKDITKVMLNKEEEIKRKKGRPKKRWMDCIEEVLKRLAMIGKE